jgi:hypothetical protein
VRGALQHAEHRPPSQFPTRTSVCTFELRTGMLWCRRTQLSLLLS